MPLILLWIVLPIIVIWGIYKIIRLFVLTGESVYEAKKENKESVLNNPEFSSGGYQRLIWLR